MLKHPHLRSSKWLCAAFVIFILSGCAALRIDVDVYKGPLANHEDIQVREFAGLAVAAKPLIAKLRNDLETRENPSFKESDDWNADRNYTFKSKLAYFVNGALSFYHDSADPRLGSIIEDAMTFWLQYKASHQRFSTNSLDASLAEIVSRQSAPLALRGDSEQAQRAKIKLSAFRKAYACFLRGSFISFTQTEPQCSDVGSNAGPYLAQGVARRPARELFRSCEELIAELKRLTVSEQRSIIGTDIILQCGAGKTATQVFDSLARRDVVESHSLALFGTKDEKFIARLQEIGIAFYSMRQEMRNLMIRIVDLVDALGSHGNQRQLDAAATALGQVVQVRLLACYLSSNISLPYPVSNGLRAELTKDGFNFFSRKAYPYPWSPEVYQQADRALERAAIAYPSELARLLNAIHQALPKADAERIAACPALSGEDQEEIKPPFARQFGLARGPTLSDDFDRLVQSMESALNVIAPETASGFDRARLREGIETLTTQFLQSLRNNQQNLRAPEVIQARRRLEEVLVAFAQRALFVVNNRRLTETANSTDDKYKDIPRHMAVLEAVGNTIILHADDLRQREEHDNRIDDRGESELRAVQLAFSQSPGQVLDLLLQELTSTVNQKRAQAARLNDAQNQASKNTDSLKQEVDKLYKDQTKARTQADSTAKTRDDNARLAGPLVAAYRTLSGETSPVAALPASDKDVKNDSNGLQKKVLTLTGKVNAGQVRDAITQWINEQILSASLIVGGSPRLERLKQSKTFFDDNQTAFQSIPDGTVASILPAVRETLANAVSITRQNLQKQDTEARAADSQAKTSEALYNAAKQRLEKQTANAVAGPSSAETTAASLSGALDVIRSVRGDVLAKADADKVTDPSSLLLILRQEVKRRQQDPSNDDAQRKKYESALTAMEGVTLPPNYEFANTSRRKIKSINQRDVLDDVIALLRQRLLYATATGETASAANLDKALAAAYEQRAGLAYLRPASMYLRSAYSSTALQEAPDVGWVNLIARNTGRAFGGDNLNPFDREFLKTRTDIDKQFWHNINSVNFAGGGATNYVLTKDDIGNWYVKAYESNPESVIKAAQGLALFSLGSGLDVNLLRRLDLQRKLDSPDTPDNVRSDARDEYNKLLAQPTGQANSNALSQVHARYQAEYESRTSTDASTLRAALAKLRSDLSATWKRDLSGDTKDSMLSGLQKYVADDPQEVQSALARLDDAEASKGKVGDQSARRADAILQSLRSMVSMRRRLVHDIGGDDTLIADQTKARTNAQGELASKQQLVDSARGELDAKTAEQTKAQAAVNALQQDAPGVDRTSREKQLADSTAAVQQKQSALATASDGLKTAQDTASKADDQYKNATSNRSQAATSARSLIDRLVREISSRRIETVKELETAISFIGEISDTKGSNK